MELDRIGPDDAGDDINQFQPWVHREISSEYSVLVVELNTIGQVDAGSSIKQFQPWVHPEILLSSTNFRLYPDEISRWTASSRPCLSSFTTCRPYSDEIILPSSKTVRPYSDPWLKRYHHPRHLDKFYRVPPPSDSIQMRFPGEPMVQTCWCHRPHHLNHSTKFHD